MFITLETLSIAPSEKLITITEVLPQLIIGSV